MSLIIGTQSENLARSFLEARGLKYLDANYRTKVGEIDLIMQDKEYIVFIEVRYRKNTYYGSALETVNKTKQKKIIHAANSYIVKKKLWEKYPIRFDIIAIEGSETKIDWIQDAFWVN